LRVLPELLKWVNREKIFNERKRMLENSREDKTGCEKSPRKKVLYAKDPESNLEKDEGGAWEKRG